MISESVNKGYLNLSALEVISDFPIEFSRLFINAIEKSIGKINSEGKTKFLEKTKYEWKRENRNIFLDSFNRNEMEFVFDKNDLNIVFNVHGSNVKFTIRYDRSSTSSDMIMKISNMTCAQFLSKFTGHISEVIDRSAIISASRSYSSKVYRGSNPELWVQPSKILESINPKLLKFYIYADVHEKYYRNECKINIKPSYDMLFEDHHNEKGSYGKYKGLNLPEGFEYQYQFDMFKRGFNFIVKYMNRNSYWLCRIQTDNRPTILLSYFAPTIGDGNSQAEGYVEGITYQTLQDRCMDQLLEEEIKLNLKPNFERDIFDIIFSWGKK